MYRLTWRLPLAGLVVFSHLQFSQIRGRQPYLIVRNILYVIGNVWLIAGYWLVKYQRTWLMRAVKITGYCLCGYAISVLVRGTVGGREKIMFFRPSLPP